MTYGAEAYGENTYGGELERPGVVTMTATPIGEAVITSANLKLTARLNASPVGEGTIPKANLKGTFRLDASPVGEGVVTKANLKLTARLNASPIGQGVITLADLSELIKPSLKGDSGFLWNPTAGTTETLDLNFPLHLEPGGVEAGHRKWREVAESLDYERREVYVVEGAGGRSDELHATIRFENDPTDLLNLLDHLADGGSADYTTDFSKQASRRTMELVNIGDLNRLSPEQSRRKAKGAGGSKEFEVELSLRATTGDVDGLID